MRNDGRRTFVPGWLTDSKQTAPCMCGQPFDPDIPFVVSLDTTTNLKRWWHMPCYYYYNDEDDEDDDEDED